MPLRCALSRLLPIMFRLSGFETAAPATDRESRTSLLAGRSANRPGQKFPPPPQRFDASRIGSSAA